MKKNNHIHKPESVVAPWQIPSKLTFIAATLLISACASTGTTKTQLLSDQLLQKIEERDQKIAERDREIDDLQRRMRQLENNNSAALKPNPAHATTTVAKTQAAEKVAVTPTPPAQPAASTTKPPGVHAKASDTQTKRSGPGSFEVDEDAAQRALERTLVQTGALLLPFGQAEIQPFVTYARRELSQPFLFSDNENVQVANAAIRRNEFDVGANLLFGLPFESQLELRVPYRIVTSSVITVDGAGSRETSNTGHSIGDLSVGLAKTLVHESEWVPDLIARLTYHAPTGTAMNNNVALGDGFHALTASMTALKRQDPLAFTARVAYKKTFKKHDVEPGDQIGFSIGATLAASPQTSLSVGLQQNYALDSRINNVKIQGSDNLSSVFTVGASSTIGRSLFFSVLGGVGLTSASPEYFLNVTIPFRFSMPYKK